MMDHLKMTVKTMWARRKRRHGSGKCSEPLIKNDDMQDGKALENPTANNAFNTAEEHFQRLCQTCDDGDSCRVRPTSAQQNSEPDVSELISRVASDSFPKPPAELDQNLKQHLTDVRIALLDRLQEISLLSSEEMKECLIKCTHHQTIAHLHNLLQNTSLSTNHLLLMNWVSQMYLSEDMPGKPDQRLLDEWEEEAKFKVFESLKNISESLHKILQTHRGQKCHDEEAYVGLYVDVIQCVDGKLQEARIHSALDHQMREICFQELLKFVKRYAAEQEELLSEEVQTWKERREKMETVLFLKTLKACKELKEYVLKGDDIQLPVLNETVQVLENLQTLTLDLLREILADIAETDVKSYFKQGSGFGLRVDSVSTHFPKLSFVFEEQKMVMNEAYKIFAHTYLKHLIKKNQYRLRLWSPNVGTQVHGDARYLHSTFSDLAPGVQPWNLMLLKIPEVLDSNDIEGLKLTVARLQVDCVEASVCSEDLQLLPALLRWKGLSKRKVKEVLEAVPAPPPADSTTVKIRSSPEPAFLCLICCS